ncbi:glycosyltransferase family 2 protein [Crocinitomicaceae bacterium]|nr:glycosyltransferase family 2 protein [Crocinitomicaceae bacterium]
MNLAIVILNYNGRIHLENYIENIISYSKGHDLIIADNASNDDSVEYIKQFNEIQLIEISSNLGFAGGYNDALKRIQGKYEYYLLLNSDVEVSENWITPLISAMDNKRVAACQPKIKSLQQKELFEHAGASGGFIDKNYFPFCRGRIFSEVEKDEGQYDNSQQITWTSGAAMLIRSELFHQADGFDSDFFAHMEEIDLCIRLGHQGHQFKVVPESVVYHLGGGTLPYNSPQKIYLNFRNSLFMIAKNHKGLLIPMLFKRMLIDAIAAYKFLFEGKFLFFWKVFMAHMDLYKNFRSLLKKRALLKNDRSPVYRYHGNILTSFFLERRKTFSKLNKRLIKS